MTTQIIAQRLDADQSDLPMTLPDKETGHRWVEVISATRDGQVVKETTGEPSVETPGCPPGKTNEERSDGMVHIFIMGPPKTLLLQTGVSPVAPQPPRPVWLWPSAAKRLSRWVG
jgi:hypothetical protein